MTVNVRETIQKIMGWCPNANALLTKRVLITLPVGDEFLLDERGKGSMNTIKMGWGNKHRNIVLLMTIMNFAILGFFIWFLPNFVKYLMRRLPEGILPAIILAIYLSASQWRYLNKIGNRKIRLSKIEIAEMILMTLLLLSTGFMAFIRMDLPYDLILASGMSAGSIFYFIQYPMTLYWERKNRKTIYLVEEKFLKWRPVALPSQSTKG
jgi:hypothetical protein